MPRDRPDDNAWLTQHSPLPTIGDEAVLVAKDVREAFQVYAGVNIQLMRCGGKVTLPNEPGIGLEPLESLPPFRA